LSQKLVRTDATGKQAEQTYVHCRQASRLKVHLVWFWQNVGPGFSTMSGFEFTKLQSLDKKNM